MNEQTNWWEPIFSGELEVGINKEKMAEMDQENFLYFENTTADLEQHA